MEEIGKSWMPLRFFLDLWLQYHITFLKEVFVSFNLTPGIVILVIKKNPKKSAFTKQK